MLARSVRSSRQFVRRPFACSSFQFLSAVRPTARDPALPCFSSAMSSAAKAGIFYRKPLPNPPCIPFSSEQGRKIFQEALAAGSLNCFFPLSEQFLTQDDPAFCGLSTMAMVLNALSIDPGRQWKGVWRWFSETQLQCCVDNETVRRLGVTFDQFVCLGRCNGAVVDAHRASDATLEQFRGTVAAICSQQPTEKPSFLVSSYSRATFGQTGDGHWSPIGGYHAALDMVLLLDVARFKYPPHWVPLALLYESMQAVDAATGRCRGYALMTRSEVTTSLLLTVSRSKLDKVSWHQLAHSLAASAEETATSAPGTDSAAAEDVLQSTMEMLLKELGAALVPITDSAPTDAAATAGDCCGPSQGSSSGDPVCCREMLSPTLFGDDHVAAIHSLRYAVEGLPLFAIAQRAWARARVSHASPFNPPIFGFGPAHVAAVLLLALSPKKIAHSQLLGNLHIPDVLLNEVQHISRQLDELGVKENCAVCNV